MSGAYYNEIDPYAAQWLRNLIKAGLIAAGDVDERSIEDVHPGDLRNYTQCHFFAGQGVWSYALRRAGVPDTEPVWSGSCPCQPFSSAGEGAGFADERHLWPAFHYLIEQCRPAVVFGEQVASKDAEPWLDLVSTDLEALGYAFGAVPFPAAGVGAAHVQDRLYWVADANHARPQGQRGSVRLDGAQGWQGEERHTPAGALASSYWQSAQPERGADGAIRLMPSIPGALANGTAGRVGRLRAYGNGLYAPAAEVFIRSVMEAA